MSASEFLDRLEQQGLLENSVVSDLRRQLEGSSRNVSAETLAKLLVENGHLTRFQASRIIDDVTAREEQRRTARAETAGARRERVTAASTPKSASEEDLLIAPLEQPGKPAASAGGGKNANAEDVVMLEPAEPAAGTSPLRPLPFEAPQRGRGGTSSPTSAGLQPLTPLAEGLTPLDDPGITSLDDSPPGSMSALGSESSEPRHSATFVKKRARTNPWDSPLILIGSGALILLIVLSVVLFFSLQRGTAQEYFDQAEKDYRGGSYANAQEKYEKYLASGGQEAPLARVRIVMCQFRMEVEGTRDPQRGLEAAKRLLPTIEKEEKFGDAREELAFLLPQLARTFASRAQELTENAKSDEDITRAETLLKSLDEAMELVNNPNYIPTSLRKTQVAVIEEINETKTRVAREINRQRSLDAALVDMQKAIDDGDTRGAFAVRQTLLKEYPGLAAHPEIIGKVQLIGERERDVVQVTQQDVVAANDDPSTDVPKTVLYSRSGSGIPGVEGQYVVSLVQGAVYGIEAGTGELKWRRFVGYDSNGSPQMIGGDADPTVLLCDSVRNELLSVRAASGELVWRLPLEEPFFAPVIWRDRALVTTQSGRILNVDLATGLSRRQTNLKQLLGVALGCAERYPTAFQVGENDHLYALSIDSMECREVFYLGHRPGTIAGAPVVAVGHVFVVENVSPTSSRVHILAMDEEGLNLKVAQDPLLLQGQVLRAPVVAGRRVIITTDLGAITALDINPQQSPPATLDLSPVAPSRSSPVLTYALADQALLWLGDSRLSAYELQATQAQMDRRWVAYEGATFVGPLQRIGDAIVHVRRDANSPGFRIAAVDGETGQTTFWQLDIAYPLLDLAADENNRLLAFSSVGAAFSIDAGQEDLSIVRTNADTRIASISFHQALPLSSGQYAMLSRAGQLLVFDPQQPGKEMRLLRLNVPANSMSSEAIIVHGGILQPLSNGQIVLLNAMSGENQVLPFQPDSRPGTQVQWNQPAPVGAEQRDFVVADNRQNMYRVGVVDTGGAHLDVLEDVTLPEPVFGPLASVEDTVYAVVRRSDGDVLVFFSLPRLREEGALPLKGPVTWGPHRVGDLVLVANEVDGLLAFDAARQQRWASPLPYGPLAGAPEMVDGDYILASQSGVVWRISGADGQEIAKHEIGEPLGGRPAVVGETIWIPGADGTVFRVPMLVP